jgi:glyoxylase-like metal-dependent hydrolase (beta-lactamase superfamily II)
MRPILPSLYRLRLGLVNAFLIEDENELILIDAGYPGYTQKILRAVRQAGGGDTNLRHIFVTHCHWDHSGSLAEVQRATGARVYMHEADAAKTRAGETRRPWQATPGWFNGLLFQVFVKNAREHVKPCEVQVEVRDGETVPLAGGLQVIHTPGHCAGQIALLWRRHGGVLFVGDAASNIPNLRLSIVHEDLAQARASLRKLAALEFQHACFGHGRPILGRAQQRFAARFSGRFGGE